jgi:NADPH:quinone reductase-like Zn-dependent oxidoreductase
VASDLSVRAIEWPSPGVVRLVDGPSLRAPDEKDVVVEVAVTVTSTGTELARFRSLPNATVSYPHRPGFMAAGVVSTGAPSIEVGSAVAVRHIQHQSRAVVRRRQVHLIPPGVDLIDGALWHLGLVALYGLERGGYTPGQPLAVVGAGIVGAIVRRLALAMGTRDCLVLATSDAKRWTVEPDTGTRFVALSETPLEEVARGYPLTIDATGAADSLQTAGMVSEPGSRVVMLGSPRAEHSVLPVTTMQERGLRVVGAHINTLNQFAAEHGGAAEKDLTERFFGLLSDGLSFADLIERHSPARADYVYETAAREPSFVAAAFDWCLTVRPAARRLRT